MGVYILNIETSTKACSVALHKNGELIVSREDVTTNFSHSEKLLKFISKLFSDAKLSLSDLDAIAVSMGPGSYTGLRIGVSTAKGLCYGLDIPLISISKTLDKKVSELIILDKSFLLIFPFFLANKH